MPLNVIYSNKIKDNIKVKGIIINGLAMQKLLF